MNKNYSFLMSVYDKENPDFLVESIESMLNQTVFPNEIVIVEDGELTECLEKIILKYEKKYPDLFNVVRRQTNKGLGFSLNEGLSICKNELVARMDSDDICFPERCEQQLKRFEQCKDLVILGTQILEFEGDISNVMSQRIVPVKYEDIVNFSHRRSPFNHPTVMYKKTIILNNGGYPTVKRKEDLQLFIDIVNKNYYCENLNASLLFYRTSQDNLKRRKTWVNCKEYIQIMFSFFKKGIINTNDLIYVIVGQLSFFILPKNLLKILSEFFLRKKK